MTERYSHLASLLIDIECELRRALLWGTIEPTEDALASTEPFCVDTMSFQEWLQFVFLPRMHQLLAHQHPLPAQCNITAMAEMVWAGTPAAKQVIYALRKFDDCINDGTP